MHWQLIGAGAEGQEVGLHLPPGVAIRIPKGARIVVESHYVNVSSEVHHVRDRVTAEPPPDPASITARADVVQVSDVEMPIPPHVSQTRVIECTLGEDMTALDLDGHAHEWATLVRVSVLRASSDKPRSSTIIRGSRRSSSSRRSSNTLRRRSRASTRSIACASNATGTTTPMAVSTCGSPRS